MNKKKVIITVSVIATAIIVYLVIYFVDVFRIMGRTTSFRADYEVYSTVEELVDAVDFVYEGTVTGYHYEVLDMRTGYKFKKKTEKDLRYAELCTIYEIDVKEKYKGEPLDKTTIMLEGGRQGDSDFIQAILAKNAGLDELQRGNDAMTVGETYMFMVCGNTSIPNYIINPEQYKYEQSDNYYNIIKEYMNSEAYTNPPKVPTEYVETKMLTTPEEIVAASDKVFEGEISGMCFEVRNSKLVMYYAVRIRTKYKGELSETLDYIYIEGVSDDYKINEQYRILNREGITKRIVFKDMIMLEKGKTYIFAVEAVSDEWGLKWYSKATNPAQFAFCSDNSNAPGGVDYKMMKEYLEK